MVTLLTGAPLSYLQEVLCRWVQWPTTEHPNSPTLEALCAALRSPTVGLGSLAEEMEKEMKQCKGKLAGFYLSRGEGGKQSVEIHCMDKP